MPVQTPFNKYYNSIILLEYSEPFINKFALKLATSVNDTGRVEEFKNYIRFFDTLRNTNQFQTYVKNNPTIFSRGGSPIADPKNIDLFNAHQLEHINDIFNPDVKKEKEETEEQQPITKDADIIYPKDGDVTKTKRAINPAAVNDKDYLEIYRGGNQATCVKFSHDVFGQSYGFCIGRHSNNLYDTYRFQQPGHPSSGPRTFYFVRDYSRPATDEFHLIVVHALQNGKFTYTNAPNNNGDKFVGDFENLLAVQPKLKGLEELFVFVSFTEEEEEYNTIKNIDASQLNTLTPKLRSVYLASGKVLPVNIFTQLTAEEQNTNIVSVTTTEGLEELTNYRGGYGSAPGFAFYRKYLEEIVPNIIKTASNHPDSTIRKLADIFQNRRSSVGFILLMLMLNTDLSFDNDGNVSHRKDNRNQPLKYFIYNCLLKGRHHVDGSKAEEILSQPYNQRTDMTCIASFMKGINEYTRIDDFTSITVGNSILLLLNAAETPAEKYAVRQVFNPILIVLDKTTGKITHSVANLISVSKHGFLVKDSNQPAPFLIKFDGNEIQNITEFNKDLILDDDNHTGLIPYQEFLNYPKNVQERLALKRIKHAATKAASIMGNNSWEFYDILQCVIEDPQTIEDLVIAEMSVDAFVKTNLRQNIHARQILPQAFVKILSTYKVCKDIGGKVFEYYMQHMHPVFIKALNMETDDRHGYRSSTLIKANGLLLKFTTTNDKQVCILDYENYKIKVLGSILMFTKKSIIISDKSNIKSFKNAIGVDKTTLELISDEALQRIEKTVNSMLKLKGSEAADVIATTYIDYGINGRIVGDLVKKTGSKLGVSTKFPPYDSIKKGTTFGPNTIVINTQDNAALQEKYTKILICNASSNFINSYKKTTTMLKEALGIELSLVILTPTRDWNGGNSFDIGFLFAKTGSNLDSAANIKNATLYNSIYIEIRRVLIVHTQVEDGVRNNTGYTLIHSREPFFSSENLKTNVRLSYVTCFSRVFPKIRAQKISIDRIIGVSADATYKIGMLNALGNINPPISLNIYKKYNSSNLTTPQESVEIPFSLFYKLLT